MYWGCRREEDSANHHTLPRTATTQKTGEASSAHSPPVRTEHPLGKERHREMEITQSYQGQKLLRKLDKKAVPVVHL